MDIQSYIESGVLENYHLGLLSEREARDVELMAQQYPQVQAELNAIEESLASYAQLHAVEPPTHLKSKVLQEIGAATPTPPTTASIPTSQNNFRTLATLTGLLFLISALAAIYFYQKNGTLETEVQQVQTQLAALQKECDDTKAQLDDLQNKVRILRDQFNRSIIMNGTDNAPNSIAQVHWNEDKKYAYLDVINMPKPPTGKQYQLWALKDGQPIDMGVFDINIEPGEFAEMLFIADADAFAISLEDEGGKPQPTLTALQVYGEV